MVNTQQIQDVLSNGGTVLDSDGSKIGKVEQVFLDDKTSEPEWVTVKTGFFGTAESFVPLSGARVDGNDITVAFNKEKVKDAPRVEDADGHLSEEEEIELFRYYAIDRSGGDATTGETTSRGREDRSERTEGHDTSGPTTDDAMTRSEEQVKIGTEKVSGGKARLRKYVVTENVTTTVPVSHEESRVEREPITDANRGDATSGGEITSEEHEIDLSAEKVVVDKDVVPVERVKLGTETVTEEQEVAEEVRKEQIDTADGGAGTGTDSSAR